MNHEQAMRAADDLDAAADIIDRDGWCQGHLFDPQTGGLCVEGAIVTAILEPTIQPALLRAIIERSEVASTVVIRLEDAAPGWSFTYGRRICRASNLLSSYLGISVASAWNDNERTSREDVTDALRRAAKGARETE